ncbi:FkbM family methyltransferase [Comamonas badia]|uniref:FkbM family methyltransferase n=1 Tax=Comamonas badia TaxID=265291 RepID=UPI000A045768|nr:FkbM family methyltransferase [Comamonas badia]
MLEDFRNSTILRAPLLALTRKVFGLLQGGPGIFQRAVYDAMSVPYIVTTHQEHYVVSTKDKVIGRELFLRGEFDFKKFQTALTILNREGQSCPAHLIDVGANIGSITIPAIKRGLVKTATAIEPHPDNLRLLKANLALNDLDSKVNVIPQAVGKESATTLYLNESPTNSGNHSIGVNGIPIKCMRLDDLPFPPNSLLWMDIEGYEGHALAGAAHLLATGIAIVCEYNPLFLNKSKGATMFREALNNRKIFELQNNTKTQTNLAAIDDELSKLPCTQQWTDIIAIQK